MDRLCPPSCLHVVWDSLTTLLVKDSYDPHLCNRLDLPFTETELNIAVSNLNFKSAPGLDQLDYKVILSLPYEYRQTLVQIYNNIFSEGLFPDQWKQSLMVLIPKPGNSGVRPISLLSCLLKILEKMIYSRLQWFVESRHILPDTQLGFRPDRSCIDSLVILISEIYKGFINNASTVCAFLNIKGAFDNVIPNILIQDLKDIGIPARTRSFILNLTCERQLHFVIDSRKVGPFLSHKGTPQGSTLSPLLFAIYLKDITKYLHHESNILLYADDIVVFSTVANIHLAHRSVQNTLDQISAYLRYRGLDLSPDKSQWMIFTRNRILPTLSSLTIFNPISKVNQVRFLGIILNSNLSDKKHLQYLLQKGSVIIDIITSLSGTWWGSHPHLLINLY